MKVFTRLDHAAAAKEYGLRCLHDSNRFWKPENGDPLKTPTVAIDLPPKAMVWQDAKGDVYFSINSAEYLFETIYPAMASSPIKTPLSESLPFINNWLRCQRNKPFVFEIKVNKGLSIRG